MYKSKVELLSFTPIFLLHLLYCENFVPDPIHFGPKTVRHYIFGTELSYFFVGAKVSGKCLGQIGGAFMFLYRFTTSRHICTVHHDLQTT